ncbi:uncharacterized protein LOC142591142 [Dermacentor variabilis]|uniref:uncharacterized protein LOC142591142 n=1 Tax=Dermacentor variabilis TaxID=34621 RepID=UPI003F5C4954
MSSVRPDVTASTTKASLWAPVGGHPCPATTYWIMVLRRSLDLTASSVRLACSSSLASQSMSLLRRVLTVLLLAGHGGLLAELYIAKCEDACGGSVNVMCEVGCNCVFYQGLTVGVCRSALSNDNILYYDGTTESTFARTVARQKLLD